MTRLAASPEFDPRVADWLEGDPDRAPEAGPRDRARRLPSIPQRPASRLPWRSRPMNRYSLGAAAVVSVVLVGVALMILRPSQGTIGGPVAGSVGRLVRAAAGGRRAARPILQLDPSPLHDQLPVRLGRHPGDRSLAARHADAVGRPGPRRDPGIGCPARRFLAADRRRQTPPTCGWPPIASSKEATGSGCPDYGTKWSADPDRQPVRVRDPRRRPGGRRHDQARRSGLRRRGCCQQPWVRVHPRWGRHPLRLRTPDGERELRAGVVPPREPDHGVHVSALRLQRRSRSELDGDTVDDAPDRSTLGGTLADDIQVTGTDTGIGGSASPLGDLTWDQLLAQLRANATGSVPPRLRGRRPVDLADASRSATSRAASSSSAMPRSCMSSPARRSTSSIGGTAPSTPASTSRRSTSCRCSRASSFPASMTRPRPRRHRPTDDPPDPCLDWPPQPEEASRACTTSPAAASRASATPSTARRTAASTPRSCSGSRASPAAARSSTTSRRRPGPTRSRRSGGSSSRRPTTTSIATG